MEKDHDKHLTLKYFYITGHCISSDGGVRVHLESVKTIKIIVHNWFKRLFSFSHAKGTLKVSHSNGLIQEFKFMNLNSLEFNFKELSKMVKENETK